MKILFIINDAPYGTERAYNALRLAMQLQKESEHNELRIFLMADAVSCALPNQNTPAGYYNIGRMLKSVLLKMGKVRICTSCVEARGMKDLVFMEGAALSTMSELAQWVMDSDKVVTF